MRILSAVLIGMCVFSLSVSAAPSFQIVDLGVLNDGDMYSQAFGVSNNGVVCGRSLGNSGILAYSWTVDGGMTGMDMAGGRFVYSAYGANDSGMVVGLSARTAYGSSPLPVAWTNGVGVELPLHGTQTVGRANDVNDSGLVVGSVGSSSEYAVTWTGTTVSAITTTTVDGVYMTTANSVNNAGLIVGKGSDPSNLARTAGLIYDTTTDTMIEMVPLADDNAILANDISENGYVAGSSSYNNGSSVPIIWDEINGTVEIPLTAGVSVATAEAVNCDGWVVGTGSGSYAVPFLYDGIDSYRLQDLIDPASGWDLSTNTSSSAKGITDSGMIVGTGVINGETHAYAMIPVPEPCSMLLLLCGGLAVVRRR